MTDTIISNAEQKLGQAYDGLVDLKDSVAKTVDHQATSLRAILKKHPLTALAVAFGAGYLISRVVHR